MFLPKYNITNEIAQNLMRIERSNIIVEHLPLPASILQSLQRQSRENTVILSTKIEGNKLEEHKKREALYEKSDSGAEQEVYNLMKALEYLDQCEARQLPITEELIKKLHAIIQVIVYGRRPRVSEYRIGQNQVGKRNQVGYYLPPEPSDVSVLMEDLAAWVNSKNAYDIPAPIKAGIFMWQFLTIHPYMDGNGRTARMLSTYILRLEGLGLKGLFVLESFYDRNLNDYYKSIQMGLSHNYYFGRNNADLTEWIDFFIKGLADVFEEAANVVQEKSHEYMAVEPDLIRELDPGQRIVFAMLAFNSNWASTSDLRKWLNLSDRTIRDKVKKWINTGFLVPRVEDAKRIRSVTLALPYKKLAEQIRREPDKYKYLLK